MLFHNEGTSPHSAPLSFDRQLQEESKAGEKLVSQLRLIVLVMLLPSYIIRLMRGEISGDYLLFATLKWGLILLYALGIFYLLRRNVYHALMGYLTLFVDLLAVFVSLMTLSFYKTVHYGTLYDTLYIGFYFITFSGTLRFDFRYSLFSIALCLLFTWLLTWFDLRYHGISADYTLLGDRFSALVMITLFSLIFIRRFKSTIMQGQSRISRRMKEISALLAVSRKIASKSDTGRTLTKISGEAARLLRADFTCLSVLPAGNDPLRRYIPSRSLQADPEVSDYLDRLEEDIARRDQTVTRRAVEKAGSRGNEITAGKILGQFGELLAVPVRIDRETAGILTAARREEIPFGREERIYLGILAEQAAVALKNDRLLKELQSEEICPPPETGAAFEEIIGGSTSMTELFRLIERAAESRIPVLIRGESGTGKELVANALHNRSSRRNGPFVKINCSAIPEHLLESELFGHERGAFTDAHRQKKGKFEMADGGTLFLDEIGDMSLSLQSKLLRVLQEGVIERLGGEHPHRVDVRLISATHQNLEEKIRNGEFREDLYYRINGLPVRVPPLRERREDIPGLVTHFLEKYAREGRQISLTRSAMELLATREWKGNVRELENLIYRLTVLHDRDLLTAGDIAGLEQAGTAEGGSGDEEMLQRYLFEKLKKGCDFSQEMETCEREFIREALRISQGNIRKAARLLNLPKSTLFNKITRHNLQG